MGSHFGHALRFEQSQLLPSPQQTRPNWLHVLSQVAVALEWADAFLAWPRHAAAATDALLQHLKVFLLFAVLLRRQQAQAGVVSTASSLASRR